MDYDDDVKKSTNDGDKANVKKKEASVRSWEKEACSHIRSKAQCAFLP